jgi:hypothetical protein
LTVGVFIQSLLDRHRNWLNKNRWRLPSQVLSCAWKVFQEQKSESRVSVKLTSNRERLSTATKKQAIKTFQSGEGEDFRGPIEASAAVHCANKIEK